MKFAQEHDLLMISIADLVRYRRHREKLVRRVSEARIPTKHGEFTAYVFESLLDGEEHMAFVRGDVSGKENVLVRVHSECLTGDVFGSMRCDCGVQLDLALEKIASEGEGVVVYLRGHEGRGIGLGHKFRAYTLQDQGRDTVEANVELGFLVDSREYGIGAQMLVDLGVTTMRLMTNNPAKYGGLEGYGLEIVERVPLHVLPNHENIRYLLTKQQKMGHLLDMTRTERRRAGNELRPERERPTHVGKYSDFEGNLDAAGMRIAIVAGRFNDHVTKPLLEGALGALDDLGVRSTSPSYWVPGAFEIPLVAQRLARLAPVRRGDLPRRGDPGRHAPLRLRGGGVRGRASRASRSTPASRASSACSRPTTSTRRWPGPAAPRATRASRRRTPRSR